MRHESVSRATRCRGAGRLVIERQADAVAELRELGRAVPVGRSLVDELLAERRRAARSE